jgi:hypothetical protein
MAVAAMPWAAAGTVRGAAVEHEAVARLRARWQPEATAEADDQASWTGDTLAGAELALDDALALAMSPHLDEGSGRPGRIA